MEDHHNLLLRMVLRPQLHLHLMELPLVEEVASALQHLRLLMVHHPLVVEMVIHQQALFHNRMEPQEEEVLEAAEDLVVGHLQVHMVYPLHRLLLMGHHLMEGMEMGLAMVVLVVTALADLQHLLVVMEPHHPLVTACHLMEETIMDSATVDLEVIVLLVVVLLPLLAATEHHQQHHQPPMEFHLTVEMVMEVLGVIVL